MDDDLLPIRAIMALVRQYGDAHATAIDCGHHGDIDGVIAAGRRAERKLTAIRTALHRLNPHPPSSVGSREDFG